MEPAGHQGVLCDGCIRRRPKSESHLAEQGLIECRMSGVDAAVVLAAVWRFAAHREVHEPFLVRGRPGTAQAWPLQFQPSAIAECGGRQP